MRKSAAVVVFTLALFLTACGPHRDLRAIRGRPALPEWRERKASRVSQGRKDQKGSKDLPVRKALKEIRGHPGLVCTS